MIAWIKFEDPKTGANARMYSNIAPKFPGATPIFKIKKLISNKGYHKQLQMFRAQFPLAPAEAITIHKSQGSTFQKVAYHVGRYVTYAHAYVAMSRATSAAGLFIVGALRIFASPNRVVTQELERLKGRPTAEEFMHLQKKPPNSVKVVSFNIQSYLPHFDAIERPLH